MTIITEKNSMLNAADSDMFNKIYGNTAKPNSYSGEKKKKKLKIRLCAPYLIHHKVMF
jgi:hypothetical protein